MINARIKEADFLTQTRDLKDNRTWRKRMTIDTDLFLVHTTLDADKNDGSRRWYAMVHSV